MIIRNFYHQVQKLYTIILVYSTSLLNAPETQKWIIENLNQTNALNVDGYDVTANQPSPYNTEVTKACDCNGACNCADSRKNNTDDSDDQSNAISTRSILSHSYSE